MSMLRFLAVGKGKQPIAPPSRGRSAVATATSSNSQIQLRLVIPNWGVMNITAPEPPLSSGEEQPRHDYPLHGELEVTLPVGSGAKRCKSIRVGLKTIITLDLGAGRRYEEDVLFERKVEIISSTSDGILLEEGLQKFDFTIIVPSNLASHDWHTNGVISHVLYADVEGQPDPSGMARTQSSSSLFGLRRPASRSTSRPGSRSASRGRSPIASPTASPQLSPVTPWGSSFSIPTLPTVPSLRNQSPGPAVPHAARTPSISFAPGTTGGSGVPGPVSLDAALANLPSPVPRRPAFRRTSTGPSPVPSRSNSPAPSSPVSNGAVVMGGGTRPNPAYISGAQSLSITRQEDCIPRVPSYDDSMASLSLNESASAAPTEPDWIMGTHTAKRNCMIVYNPNTMGGTNELLENVNGFVPGLGLWSWRMISDVWCIGALVSFKLNLQDISPKTTIFSVQLLLNQTHSIVSPRDEDGKKHDFVRVFPIMSEGKRPAEGYYYPDKRHAAIWRGKEAGGTREGGDLLLENKCRMPNDNVARPSTVPGVVTPISVSHTLTLEVTFSVWGEDDLGNAMPHPTFGGLRMLRVSRPVVVPSCCLVPAFVDLPTYENHANDKIPDASEATPTDLPGWEWCACGWQISELESRMRQSIFAQQAEANAAAEAESARSSISDGSGDKLANERGRQRNP